MAILIEGGVVVTPRGSMQVDVRVEGGKIVQVGMKLPFEGAQRIDAAGCFVFPGFIDAHTHFEMDNGTMMTADDFESGTRGAIAGGTTTIVDFATQEKGGTLKQALEAWHKKADGHSSCDYAFHMAITDWNERTEKELAEMVRAGVTSFKLYMAYDNLRVTDAQLYEVLCRVRAMHGIVGVHCENGDLVNVLTADLKRLGELGTAAHPLSRPDYVEAEAVGRYLAIAKAANAPVNIVHLSTRKGLDAARNARAEGQQVYIETCPQYLTLNEKLYALPDFEGAKYVCSPPLRAQQDSESLWNAISGGEIDTVSTDHCSFNLKGQKEQGREDFSKIPNGMPGVEHRPAVMFAYGVKKERITKEQMAALLSENTARLFGMYPQKGVIAPGSDADIVVWDPEWQGSIMAKAMHMNVDYTPYEGMNIIGRAKHVLLRGQEVVRGGEMIAEKCGAYVARHTSEYYRSGK